MAVVGYLGESADSGIVFQVSDKQLLTLDNWIWSGSARYATHERHNYHALTEYTGLDPDQITFEIQLLSEFGVNPLDEVVKLWKYEREGVAVVLSVGTKFYGKYRWTIASHEVSVQYTNRMGDITGAVVSVTLQEYLRI